MNLRTGDKAIVVYSGYDINLGKVVEVLRPQHVDDESYISDTKGVNFWYVRCEEYLYTSTVDEKFFWVDQELVLPECCLRKIEDGAVRRYPVRPNGFKLTEAEWPVGVKEKQGSAQELCKLEWAWSPINNRIQIWTLAESECGNFYLLSTGYFNDESLFIHYDDDGEEVEGPEAWILSPLGYCEVHKSLSFREHAVLLLQDTLWNEARDHCLDRFHWINEDGILNCADLEIIAIEVWGEDE